MLYVGTFIQLDVSINTNKRMHLHTGESKTCSGSQCSIELSSACDTAEAPVTNRRSPGLWTAIDNGDEGGCFLAELLLTYEIKCSFLFFGMKKKNQKESSYRDSSRSSQKLLARLDGTSIIGSHFSTCSD